MSARAANAIDARLLERALPEGYLEEWAERLRERKADHKSGLRAVMIFRIGRELLALPTALFSEVTGMLPVHRVPHRDADLLRGLVNVRGGLLPCVGLAHLLGLSADVDGEAGTGTGNAGNVGRGQYGKRMAVVEKDGKWAFPISEMLGMERYHPDDLQDVPATVAGALKKYSLGVFITGGRSVGLLDHELLFYTLRLGLS
ncbi:MAG: chemotaxis protein CheW [Planctomycetota bacterium]